MSSILGAGCQQVHTSKHLPRPTAMIMKLFSASGVLAALAITVSGECDVSDTIVACSGQSLTSMPEKFHRQTVRLDLSNNGIKELVSHRQRRAWTSTCDSQVLENANYYEADKRCGRLCSARHVPPCLFVAARKAFFHHRLLFCPPAPSHTPASFLKTRMHACTMPLSACACIS